MALNYDDIKMAASALHPAQAMEVAKIAQMAADEAVREGRLWNNMQPSVSRVAYVESPKRINNGPGTSMGRLVCNWPALVAVENSAELVDDLPPYPDNATKSVKITQHASLSNATATAALAAYLPLNGEYPPVGQWIYNDGERPLDFRLRFNSTAGISRSVVYGGTAAPKSGWRFYTLSQRATVQSTWTLPTDQIAQVRVEQWNAGPNGAWLPGEYLIFGATYADVRGRAKFCWTFDDVPSTAVRPYPITANAPVSGRSALQIMNYFKWKGTVYLTLPLVGGVATNITVAEVNELARAGWTIGSHSTTHPVDAVGAGLRLLGPYGYNRSRASRAANATEAITALDCRIISATASTDVLTCENSHLMSVGGKVMFLDQANTPAPFIAGVTYYVTAPSGANMKLSSSAANANAGIAINITANWAGVAEWRWPGSRMDDTAIYEDIVNCIRGLTLLGFSGHEEIFALPQGGWDHYVRTAVQRAGIRHARGIVSTSANARTLNLGYATGGSSSSTPYYATGLFPAQSDAASTDNSWTELQFKAYVDEGCKFGYTMMNYHHSVFDSPDVLHAAAVYVKEKELAGLLDVCTVGELFKVVELY